MLTNQHKLHSLLKKQTISNQQRQEILNLIRVGRYELPDCAFEAAFALLKTGASGKQRFTHTGDLITAGMQLKIGAKLKGYLQKFRAALGDVPYIRKLNVLVDYVSSNEPNSNIFEDLLFENRANYDSKKQALTQAKIECRWDDYVKDLNQFLKENPNDLQTWMQLGDIYTEKSQYLRALFCYEEVVILNPDNDYYFVRLAELYFTEGGKENVRTAVKYYSYVVSRNPNNARALWGLWRSLWVQSERDLLQQQDRELMEKVRDSIAKLYSKKNPALKLHLAL